MLASDVIEDSLSQEKDLNLKPGTPWASDTPFNVQDLLGTWIYSAEIRGKDGQKSEEKLILHFDESGQYYVVYQFQQASGARTTKTQAGIFGCRTGFCLEYENGKDILRIDGLNPSELWLTYFPDPVHRATSLSCKRATSQPAQATLPRESSRLSILM